MKVFLEVEIRRIKCKSKNKIKQEVFNWMADNPAYAKGFVYHVGKRCQVSTIKAVAKEEDLDWKTVKEFEKEYMKEKLKNRGEINPEVLGIDEVSIKKGHTYRIIVSDLKNKLPIWIGGNGRKEEDMQMFYNWLGKKKCANVKLAVMDMWKAFEKSAKANIPQAAILYDKFHVLRHLGKALEKIRISEYKKVSQDKRKFIKGQKYTLLSKGENLNAKGKKSLEKLFEVNEKLSKAYILKESFEQLWSYKSEVWAKKFFENWKETALREELTPYISFTKLIEKHWDGIAAYCKKENKVSLGFVEGFNNKIRVIQRRAYGLKDEEYFRLKVLTCMLPELDLNLPT